MKAITIFISEPLFMKNYTSHKTASKIIEQLEKKKSMATAHNLGSFYMFSTDFSLYLS